MKELIWGKAVVCPVKGGGCILEVSFSRGRVYGPINHIAKGGLKPVGGSTQFSLQVGKHATNTLASPETCAAVTP